MFSCLGVQRDDARLIAWCDFPFASKDGGALSKQRNATDDAH